MQRYREPQVLFFPVSLLLIFVIFIFCMDFVLPESLLLSIVLASTMFLKKYKILHQICCLLLRVGLRRGLWLNESRKWAGCTGSQYSSGELGPYDAL